MNTTATPRRVTPKVEETVEQTDIYSQEILLEPRLLELVRLRVAQICRSQLCINHHTQTLLDQGELKIRIEHLDSWRASGLYSKRERTALAVAEALGITPLKPVSKATVEDAKVQFNDAELLQLTLSIFVEVNGSIYRRRLAIPFNLWQFNSKDRPLARLAFHRNSALVGLNNRFDETQAQPEPSLRPAFITPVKPLPNPWLLGWRYSNAIILDRSNDHSFALST